MNLYIFILIAFLLNRKVILFCTLRSILRCHSRLSPHAQRPLEFCSTDPGQSPMGWGPQLLYRQKENKSIVLSYRFLKYIYRHMSIDKNKGSTYFPNLNCMCMYNRKCSIWKCTATLFHISKYSWPQPRNSTTTTTKKTVHKIKHTAVKWRYYS